MNISIRIVLGVLIALFLSADFVSAQEKDVFSFPANRGYREPWTEDRSAEPRSLAWYPIIEPGKYELFLETGTEHTGKASRLTVTISSPEIGDFEKISKEVEDSEARVAVCGFTVEKRAYYRIGISSEEPLPRISGIVLEAAKSSGAKALIPQNLSSPSVHLWPGAADDVKRNFDWYYAEVQVPEGFDPMYTYWSAIGFNRGYFGIQVNSATERRVLFSIWDSSSEAVDRAKVPDEDRVFLIDKQEGIHGGSFGNEGTGGQTFWRYPWKTGDLIRFVVNVRHLPGEFALYSAWFMDREEDGWKYMATWRAPREKRFLTGFYSFLENFGHRNGQETRKGFYGNYWAHEHKGDWIELPKVGVSHTDGKPDGRYDYEGGKALDGTNRFYMQSGGYTATKDQKSAEAEKTGRKPAVDLDALNARIDEALKNHTAR